jgi:hypothetical protein
MASLISSISSSWHRESRTRSRWLQLVIVPGTYFLVAFIVLKGNESVTFTLFDLIVGRAVARHYWCRTSNQLLTRKRSKYLCSFQLFGENLHKGRFNCACCVNIWNNSVAYCSTHTQLLHTHTHIPVPLCGSVLRFRLDIARTRIVLCDNETPWTVISVNTAQGYNCCPIYLISSDTKLFLL